jgi:sortase A
MLHSFFLSVLVAAVAAHAPAHLRAGASLGTIEIPRIQLTAPLTQGGRDIYTNPWPAELDHGPAHEPDTALPWQRGIVGIAGHRTTWTHPFRWLNRLHHGNVVLLRTRWARFTYRVVRIRIVRPTNTRILLGRSGHWLVLTACTPPGYATYRIAVTAKLVAIQPRSERRR